MITENRSAQKIEHGSEVILGRKKFTVNLEIDDNEIYLNGGRSALYFLRGFIGEDTGVRNIVSVTGGVGEPIRDKSSRRIRVLVLGNMIQDVT